jgi:hypothetical protein
MWNSVFHTEGVWEQGAEENIQTQEGGENITMSFIIFTHC